MDYNNIDFSFDALESRLLSDSHTGLEIDYDPEFLELENMVTIKAEQQYGTTIIPAAPIDWSRALNKACELLGKSKDYRLCCIITRALTHKYGVTGTLKGIEFIIALSNHYWLTAFPAIEQNGEIDLLPRANAIAELNSPTGLVGDLRHTDIKLGSAGKITLGQAEKTISGRTDSESFSRDQLLQILQNEVHVKNSEILAINQLHLKISELENLLTLHFDNEQSPDLSQLKTLLANLNVTRAAHLTEDIDETENIINSPEKNAVTPNSYQETQARIKNRADAINLLDKVCLFLEHNDPANPAPLLIKRARNMIGQDFYTILSQLAPDAVAQAEQITGTQL